MLDRHRIHRLSVMWCEIAIMKYLKQLQPGRTGEEGHSQNVYVWDGFDVALARKIVDCFFNAPPGRGLF